MTEELMDELNEKGRVIGKITLDEAHKTGAWHRVIHVYLINDKKEILLQLRSKNMFRHPNEWDISCGGHVAAGEKTNAAAQREVKEELGIELKKSDFRFFFTVRKITDDGDYHNRELVDVFVVKTKSYIDDFIIQKEEVAEIKYVPIKDFCAMVSNKQADLLQHEEYAKIIPYLKKM